MLYKLPTGHETWRSALEGESRAAKEEPGHCLGGPGDPPVLLARPLRPGQGALGALGVGTGTDTG